MNKLEELIKEYCPNGVEYKKLSEICIDIIVPMRDRPKVFDGEIPWCRIEDKEGQYFHKSLSGLGVSEKIIKEMNLKVFPTGTVICSCSASLGNYAINTQPLITNQTFIGLVCSERLFNKFLLYYMETQTSYLRSQASTGTIPYISRQKFEEMKVPVPPLPVQREIVRILDNFTELTTQLTAELTAELAARKKQYEYYRNKLLVETDAPLRTLQEVTNDIFSGKNKKRMKDGQYPVYGSTGIISTTDTAAYNKTQILIARVGANAGYVHIADGEYDVSDNTLIVDLKDGVSLKYVYYQLSNMNLHQYAKGGGQPLVTGGQMKAIEIPMPSLTEQNQIAKTIDCFYSLCNDITDGLPAEIEARQKQYEYYRDKLLSFEEKNI